MNCKICNDDVIATIYHGHCSEMCEMQGTINELEEKLAEAKVKLSNATQHLVMTHAILSGGGLLRYRVDKAIRRLEEWLTKMEVIE